MTSRQRWAALADRAEVESTLAAHHGLVERIEGVGSARVRLSTPCDESKALVGVRYESSSERAEIERILQQVDGFGVPVEVVPA